MLYPFGGCETQAYLNMSNVSLTNITQRGGIFPPGIVRCNATLPCTGFVFDNVQATGWWSILGLGYITENIIGTVTNSEPAPAFRESNLPCSGPGCTANLGYDPSVMFRKLIFGMIERAFGGKKEPLRYEK